MMLNLMYVAPILVDERIRFAEQLAEMDKILGEADESHYTNIHQKHTGNQPSASGTKTPVCLENFRSAKDIRQGNG